jgi:drug/metabolite transporter (DMT)-like permease
MGEAFALACAINWSLSMVFTRRAQGKTNLDQMIGLFVTIFVNNVINLVALVIRHFVWHPVPLNVRGIVLFVFGGVFNSFVGRGLLFSCVAILGAARGGLMKAIVPVFVLIGGVCVLGERLGFYSWAGIAIVLCGLLLMSIDSARKSGSMPEALQQKKGPEETGGHEGGGAKQAKDRARTRLLAKGTAAGIAAAFFLGAGNVCRKAGIAVIPDTVIAVSFCSFFALVVCVIVLLFQRKGREMLMSLRHIECNYGISGVFTSGALYSLFAAMRHIPISIANSISATEPLFTLLFVWLFRQGKKEALGTRTLLFGLIMVAGTIILIL